MTGRVEGKVALVTGAAKGLGAAQARLLASEGARVLLTDVDEAAGGAVAATIGEHARFVAHDVTSSADWTSAVAAAEDAFGPISVLVNNAGIFVPGSLDDLDEATVRRVFEVNALGVFLGMKHALGSLRRAGGGSIVNVSSSAGLVGAPQAVAYVGSKFAVRGMTKAAAIDLAPDGIRVNSVHPGLVDTPIFDGFPREVVEGLAATTPMGRLGTPEEIAPLVLYLASGESRFSTGAEFAADGGYAAQ